MAAVSSADRALTTPLFQFGVIADVQYADADDAWDFHKLSKRRYRHALVAFAKAVAEWNSVPTLAFVAQLGDLMDGKVTGCAGRRRRGSFRCCRFARVSLPADFAPVLVLWCLQCHVVSGRKEYFIYCIYIYLCILFIL